MSKEVKSISAIWESSVKSSIEECAVLALNFMIKLKELDENSFGKWFEKGRSKKEALIKEDFSQYLNQMLHGFWLS